MVGYADDLLLLAPTREAAQVILQVCEEFAANSNILFSTDPDPKKSKSKALYVIGSCGAALHHYSCVAAPCTGCYFLFQKDAKIHLPVVGFFPSTSR